MKRHGLQAVLEQMAQEVRAVLERTDERLKVEDSADAEIAKALAGIQADLNRPRPLFPGLPQATDSLRRLERSLDDLSNLLAEFETGLEESAT